MYVADGGAIAPLFSTGDLLPGLPAGSTMLNFDPVLLPKINEHGDLIAHGKTLVPPGARRGMLRA